MTFEMNYWLIINIAHALILGPGLAYTGWSLLSHDNVNPLVKGMLPYIGALIIGYHSIRAYQKINKEDGSYSDMLGRYSLQVNLAHLLFIGPLIAWVGYKLSHNRDVTQLEKLLLCVLGAAGTVYHSLSAYKKMI